MTNARFWLLFCIGASLYAPAMVVVALHLIKVGLTSATLDTQFLISCGKVFLVGITICVIDISLAIISVNRTPTYISSDDE